MDDLSPAEHVRRIAVRLAALGQDGETYAVGDYDLDRYRQIRVLAAELLGVLSDRPAADLALELGRDSGYATPKLDVRGVLFDADDRVLLLQERSDGRWSLPGGWADPGDTPSQAVVREVREETGHHVRAEALIACWDRDAQGHRPPLPVGAYKLFFLCAPVAPADPPDPLETLQIGWFALDDLPPLSPGRVTEMELQRALAHHHDRSLPTEFD